MTASGANPSTAQQRAFDGLRRMIAIGRLAPGERLPSETELCDELGVARSSLREAQKMLVVSGVLESRRGSGTYVSALQPADVMSSLGLVIGLLPLEPYLQLYELRRVLEGHAAAQAAARMPASDRLELRRIAQRQSQLPHGDESTGLDDQFHQLLMEASGSSALVAFLATFRERGRRYVVFDGPHGAELKMVNDQAHADIAEAIIDRDPVRAQSLATAHILTTERWLRELNPTPSPDPTQ